MRESGLTPQQIRDRLRAEGYPENLLDAYMEGGAPPDSTSIPSDDIFAAIQSIVSDAIHEVGGRLVHDPVVTSNRA